MTDQSGLPPGHQQFYRLAEMASLIALRVNPHGESMRNTVDKVRKRIVYAADQGELHYVGPKALGLFFVPEVLVWAREKWPGALSDLPVSQEANAQVGMKLDATLSTYHIPGDLARCQEALQDALLTNRELERRLSTTEAEIERLGPLAEKYEQNREKNRQSARKPRKDPWHGK